MLNRLFGLGSFTSIDEDTEPLQLPPPTVPVLSAVDQDFARRFSTVVANVLKVDASDCKVTPISATVFQLVVSKLQCVSYFQLNEITDTQGVLVTDQKLFFTVSPEGCLVTHFANPSKTRYIPTDDELRAKTPRSRKKRKLPMETTHIENMRIDEWVRHKHPNIDVEDLNNVSSALCIAANLADDPPANLQYALEDDAKCFKVSFKGYPQLDCAKLHRFTEKLPSACEDIIVSVNESGRTIVLIRKAAHKSEDVWENSW